MAYSDGGKQHWDDEDRFYSSGSHSDDSPVLSYRYEKYRRYMPYVREIRTEEKERSALSVLAKFFLACTAMILFCVVMYIPMYNKANYQLPKGIVGTLLGWSVHTNRDTKIYVQPDYVTTIYEPKDVCPHKGKIKKNNLLLLIVVCSSTVNFEERNAIRETWGNYENYVKISKVFSTVRDKYKNYNYSYDLYSETDNRKNNVTVNNSLNKTRYNSLNKTSYNVTVTRRKRDISSFNNLLPELAKALQNNLEDVKTEEVPEKRFDDEDSMVLPDFDMNKELGDHTKEKDYDNNYDYESNVMKIPPDGEDDNQNLAKIIDLLKKSKIFPKSVDLLKPNGNTEPDFKLVFLLGLPVNDNDTEIQNKIEEEVQKYGDIIQEDFVDSYSNLTLKSMMMLKWVTNKCNESVRYILKTDDDMYINVPNLVLDLRNRSTHHDSGAQKGGPSTEYLLIGALICGARPVLDAQNKWYSPRYMYGRRVYPRYVSGTGYVMSTPTAHALYAACLRTRYFHLEDIYITGMCSVRASPRITPRDDPLFSYRSLAPTVCAAHAQATTHRVSPRHMRALHTRLLRPVDADKCERMRLTQVRRERMRPKHPPKTRKLSKLSLALT